MSRLGAGAHTSEVVSVASGRELHGHDSPADGGRAPGTLDPTTDSALEGLQGMGVESTSPARSDGFRRGSAGWRSERGNTIFQLAGYMLHQHVSPVCPIPLTPTVMPGP